MKFFRRNKLAPPPKDPDPGTLAAIGAMREFRELATRFGVGASYIDVTADFGNLMERRSADVLPTPEAELPHPEDLIWRALMVTIALHAPQREYAKTAAVLHLQQYVSAEVFAPYGAAVEAARAFMRSIGAGPEQGLAAAEYVGDALERIRPLQRQTNRASRQANFDVSRRFPTFWDGPDYFFWRHAHLSDLLDAAADAVAAIRVIRGGDRPELPDEKDHPQWKVHSQRLVELTTLSAEADMPLATLTAEDEQRHKKYRTLLVGLVLAVARIGAPADEEARVIGLENYTSIAEALGKIRDQEQAAITAAFTSGR